MRRFAAEAFNCQRSRTRACAGTKRARESLKITAQRGLEWLLQHNTRQFRVRRGRRDGEVGAEIFSNQDERSGRDVARADEVRDG